MKQISLSSTYESMALILDIFIHDEVSWSRGERLQVLFETFLYVKLSQRQGQPSKVKLFIKG